MNTTIETITSKLDHKTQLKNKDYDFGWTKKLDNTITYFVFNKYLHLGYIQIIEDKVVVYKGLSAVSEVTDMHFEGILKAATEKFKINVVLDWNDNKRAHACFESLGFSRLLFSLYGCKSVYADKTASDHYTELANKILNTSNTPTSPIPDIYLKGPPYAP